MRRDHVDREEAAVEPLRRARPRRRPVAPRRPWRSAWRRRSAPLDRDDSTGESRKGGNSVRSGVVDLARARRLGQHLGVDRGELDAAGTGSPRTISSVAAGDRDPARHAHHEPREPVPEALARGRGRRARRGGAGTPARASSRASPSSVSTAGSTISAIAAAISATQGAADAHRVEEALREDDQRGDRAGDGERR